jgi:hypothetical protein
MLRGATRRVLLRASAITVAVLASVILWSTSMPSLGELATPHHQRRRTSIVHDEGTVLTTALHAADPAVHVWGGHRSRRVYIYCTHDMPEVRHGGHDNLLTEVPFFYTTDYTVVSTDLTGGNVTVHPVALRLQDIPWATSRLWAYIARALIGLSMLY